MTRESPDIDEIPNCEYDRAISNDCLMSFLNMQRSPLYMHWAALFLKYVYKLSA